MPAIPFRETRRLFGETNVPDYNTNVRHRALLRKALEVRTPEELQATFGQPIRLRVAMGSAFTSSQLGKIKTNFVRNGRLVSNETAPPDPEVQAAIRAYRTAYDSHFMSTGKDYAVRNAAAKSVLQAAEQRWHDFIVPYRAARGMPARPAWALEPLRGFDRVRIAPELPAHVPGPAPGPGPAPAPAPGPAPGPASVPAVAPRFWGVIDISDDEEAAPAPRATQRRHAQLPTPPPSSPVRMALSRIDDEPRAIQRRRAQRPTSPPSSPVRMDLSRIDDEPARPAPKRKFVDLGIVDVSDDEDDDAMPPRKKARFLGYIDLTI
ncbi:hypothetical protein DFH09DRAFT_1307699 [Mycena vulgaris]|nr:hypothetical protein DFH09DRAFT_1307699 [Mycena vulgaris]